MVLLFFFKQKTAYEISTRDWSSDVCSSPLLRTTTRRAPSWTCWHGPSPSPPGAAMARSHPDRLVFPPTTNPRAATRTERGRAMPIVKAKDGCPINYQVEGPASAPALMLCNSLGTNLHMWDEQAAEWSKHLRLVRYDRRGHGQSGAPKGPYTMDMLGNHALAVADAAR